MTFRVVIAIAVTLMLSYYGSSDAYAQRARPFAQPEIEGETDLLPAIGRRGSGGAAREHGTHQLASETITIGLH